MKIKALSLLELLLAIAISAAIMLAAVRYYSTVSASQRLTTLENQVNAMYKAVAACIGQQSPTTGNDTSTCFDETWMTTTSNYLAASTLQNPYGGANNLVNALPDAKLVLIDVPSDVCDKLASRMINSLPASTTISMQNTSSWGTQCVALIPLN